MFRSIAYCLSVTAFLFVASPEANAATADVVVLENGNEFVGRVRRHTDERLDLDVEHGTITFKASDVREVRRDVEVRLAPPASGGGLKPTENEIRDSVALLGSDDHRGRAEARHRLLEIGPDAAPALAAALASQNPALRTEAARLLGIMRLRGAVRSMLVALRSVAHDDGTVPPWQKDFAEALQEALKSVTGRSFADINGWLAWWEGELGEGRPPDGPAPLGAYLEWDTPQMGALPAPGESPDRDWILWQMSRVGSSRYSYLPPAQSWEFNR